ncbi:MAG: hypothetical protein ABIH48_00305 [Candidatus Falkowbacteria bacterium]
MFVDAIIVSVFGASFIGCAIFIREFFFLGYESGERGKRYE